MWTALEMHRPISDPAAFYNKTKSKIKKWHKIGPMKLKPNPNHGDALSSWYYWASSTDRVLVCAVVRSGETFLRSSSCQRLLKTWRRIMGWRSLAEVAMELDVTGCSRSVNTNHRMQSQICYISNHNAKKGFFTQKWKWNIYSPSFCSKPAWLSSMKHKEELLVSGVLVVP